LQEGYRRIMRTIYSPPIHYKRIQIFLREYKLRRNRTHLDIQHILAFFRSSYHLGLKSRGRFHYWSLLVWTLVHRPKAFPLAVTLAIYGYHFRKSFE
jgi:hypothetical protein